MKKVFKFLGDALLRFYTEIIAGIWMVITFIPLDCFLYTRITGKPSYPLYGKTLHYFTIFYIFYTIFFLSSAILVPLIRRKRLCNTLKRFERSKQITYVQRKKIFNAVSDMSYYKSFFSVDGFLHFLMENIFGMSVMFAYFGFEGIIDNLINGNRIVVPMIFVMLFVALLILEDLLDDYLGYRIRAERFHSQSNQRIHGAKRTLMMQILQDAGCGSSSSDDLCQIALEDIIDDIGEIIEISNDTEEVKMHRKIRKVMSTKGRIEKIKKGIVGAKKIKPVMAKKKRARRKTIGRKKTMETNSNNI